MCGTGVRGRRKEEQRSGNSEEWKQRGFQRSNCSLLFNAALARFMNNAPEVWTAEGFLPPSCRQGDNCSLVRRVFYSWLLEGLKNVLLEPKCALYCPPDGDIV